MCYPIGIHFCISQLLSYLAIALIQRFTDGGVELYYKQVILLTGVAGLLTMIPLWFLYKTDHERRVTCGMIARERNRLFPGEIILLFLLGAALAFYGNLLIGLLGSVLDPSSYTDLMNQVEEGQSLFTLIFWMGFIAPVAEEFIFRWLVFLRLRDYCRHAWAAALLSGLLFGIYHGNLVQAVYASILGFVFAMLLEWTGNRWTTVYLHIGANVASLLLSEVLMQQGESIAAAATLYLLAALLAVLIFGIRYFRGMSKDHPRRVE